jgi:hypothetical protein
MSIEFNMEWDPDEFKRRVREQASKGFREVVADQQQKIQAMTCPTHGEHPQVAIVNGGEFESRLEASGFCCEEFADSVKACIASLSGDDESKEA